MDGCVEGCRQQGFCYNCLFGICLLQYSCCVAFVQLLQPLFTPLLFLPPLSRQGWGEGLQLDGEIERRAFVRGVEQHDSGGTL